MPAAMFFLATCVRAAEQASGQEATWEIEADAAEGGEGRARTEDEPFNPDFNIVERVVAEQK